MFDRQVKPHYIRAFTEIKEYYLKKNPLGKIQFHSCGAIPEPFMRGLIESGVDGYDSLPPKVARHSNPAAKKRQLGNEMFFYGGIDVQEHCLGAVWRMSAVKCDRESGKWDMAVDSC